MKKALRYSFSMILVLILVVSSITGCSPSTPAPTSEKPAASNNAAAEKPSISFTFNNSYSGGYKDVMSKEIAEKVAELSGGRIKCQIVAAGTMGVEREVGEAIQLGSLDMAYLSDVGLEPVVGKLSWAWLPFMIKTNEDADKYYFNGWIRDEMDKVYKENKIIVIAKTENGFRHYGNTKRPVESIKDLKAQKARVPEQADLLRFYELCGALPVAIAGSETLTALEQKTIDGADNTLYNLWDNGLLDSLKYVTLTSHQYSASNIVVSEKFWNSLSDEDKAIIKETAEFAGENYKNSVRQKESELIKEYTDKGVKFTEPNPEFASELKKVGDQIWDEFKGKYDPKIMEQIMKDFGGNK